MGIPVFIVIVIVVIEIERDADSDKHDIPVFASVHTIVIHG